MTESEAREPVFALLADPATHGGGEVERIDTHAASVFLAGERAYKVKRAVRFPFLDYSTLAQRKRACEAELEVNRPFAPRSIVAWWRSRARGRRPRPRRRRHAGGMGGGNAPLRRARDPRQAGGCGQDRCGARGRARSRMAAAHAAAPAVEAGPWIKALAGYIDEHVAAFRAPDIFPPDDSEALARASRAAYARIHPLLVERARAGLVRRIHGDLHLGNIVLLEGPRCCSTPSSSVR